MATRAIDVLVLGRHDDADVASGATRLWTAGTRPFGAGCVVVAATGRVHLLASWDAGIPASIPFDDLYPITWNPQVMAASLRSIEGLTGARRIGVDALSPSFERAVADLAPGAELVPADDLMAAIRRRKSPAEIAGIRAACAVAWAGVDAAQCGGRAHAVETLARSGATVPSSGVRVDVDRDAVIVDVGLLLDGFEGGVGGRFVAGERTAPPPIVGACRDGATWDDLAAAAATSDWCVRGLGRGFEGPVLSAELGRGERLESEMVLSVSDGDHRDVVVVTADDPDVLSARDVRPPRVRSISTSMRAAVLQGPGRLDVEDVPVPAVGPHDVLVEVEACGVCGSDLHLVLHGWGRPGTVPGHEWTGIVAAVGALVSRWAVGDAVVGGGAARCGRCPHCLAGRPSLCVERNAAGEQDGTGAFARYIVSADSTLLARPHGMPERTAALVEPLAVALHGIERSGARPGQRVLVSGAGPIGALTIAALRSVGVDDVVAVEPHAARQQLAAAVGATEVRRPEDLVVPSIAEPGSVVDGWVDVAIECSGHARAMEAALGQLRRGGTLVLVGAGIEPPRFDPNRILLNELVVTGAYEYGAGGFEHALDLLASGRLPVDRLLEPDDVPLAGTLDAMVALSSGMRAGKVLVDPRRDGDT